MRKSVKGGYTLLEIMIVLAVASVLFGMVLFTIISSIRWSETEKTIMEMDTNATQTLTGVAAVLREAVLPIVTDVSDASGFQGAVNSKAKGFGENGEEWAEVLKNGSDLVPFAVPVDGDGDKDMLDADFLPELGITSMTGQILAGAEYTASGSLDGNLDASLAEIEPDDFDLDAGSGDINPGDSRFAADFAFPPTTHSPAYGVIRFEPFRENGEFRIMEETKLARDINEDGDTEDKFVLGHVAACYPEENNTSRTKYLSRASVLLQLNRNASWEPLFRLTRYKEGDVSENLESVGGALSAGDFTLHVKLLLCDNLGQRNPVAFNPRMPFLARKFDRVIVLRNMSMR